VIPGKIGSEIAEERDTPFDEAHDRDAVVDRLDGGREIVGFVFAVVWNWLTLESAPAWATDSKRLGSSAPAAVGD